MMRDHRIYFAGELGANLGRDIRAGDNLTESLCRVCTKHGISPNSDAFPPLLLALAAALHARLT